MGGHCGGDAWAGLGGRFACRINAHISESRYGTPNSLPVAMGDGGGFLAEVGVVLVDPVLAGWCEDVEVDGVFEGGR